MTVPAKYQVSTIQTCLKKGWHCLSEKPLGFSTLDCKELQNLAKKQKVKLRVLLPERWSLAQLWSHWKPKKGPWTINALRSGPFLPRSADTNVLHDMMIHDIDMFLLISEVFEMASIKKIRAWGRKLRSQNLDYAIVAFDLEDGGMARFFSSKLSTEIRRSWEMTGPDWHSTIDFKNNEMLKFSAQKRGRLFDAKKSKWGSADPLNHAVKAFLHQVNDHTAAQKYDFSQLSSLSVAPRNILRTHQLMDRILGKIQVIPN